MGRIIPILLFLPRKFTSIINMLLFLGMLPKNDELILLKFLCFVNRFLWRLLVVSVLLWMLKRQLSRYLNMHTFFYHNALMNSSKSLFRFHSVAFTPPFLNLMWEHMWYIGPYSKNCLHSMWFKLKLSICTYGLMDSISLYYHSKIKKYTFHFLPKITQYF